MSSQICRIRYQEIPIARPKTSPLGTDSKTGSEATVNARVMQSDTLLRQIRDRITARVPLVDWPPTLRAALGRALVPAPDEHLNTAGSRKVEALRFWIRIDAEDLDRLAQASRPPAIPREIGGDPVEFAYIVDRLRANLASGWDRPQVVR